MRWWCSHINLLSSLLPAVDDELSLDLGKKKVSNRQQQTLEASWAWRPGCSALCSCCPCSSGTALLTHVLVPGFILVFAQKKKSKAPAVVGATVSACICGACARLPGAACSCLCLFTWRECEVRGRP